MNVIDSASIVAEHIASTLHKMELLNNTKRKENRFYVSKYTKSFEESAKFFFKEEIELEEKVFI